MPRARTNGIELEYDTFGSPDDPTVLLIMGLGAQMVLFDERFCRMLAERGFHVVRYDNRDIGLSSRCEGQQYTLADMAADAVGLLDVLGVAAAHVVGVSMGGMIGQVLAIDHAARVLTLTSVMSHTGNPAAAQATPQAAAVLTARPAHTRDEAIQQWISTRRIIAGDSPEFPFDEDWALARAIRNVDRSYYPEGVARQYLGILASGDRTEALASVRVPTLVIHGDNDPLVPLGGGEATAQAIPGARLMVIEGMGHDLPRAAWPVIVDAIADHASAHAPIG